MKTRMFFEKTDFICSSASPVGWWLSYDSSSFSYDDDYKKLSSISVWCSSTTPEFPWDFTAALHRLQLT